MKSVLTHCDECERTTNHKVLYSKKVRQELSEDYKEIRYDFYMVISCFGCKTVSFLLRQPAEDPENPNERYFIDDRYPQDSNYYLSLFNFLNDEDQDMLPSIIYDLYEEIKTAFENNSCVLAGIGLRTLVEAVCLNRNIPGKNLLQKISNLQSLGMISTSELPILDKLRQIGNLSTHQIKAVSIEKLNYALDIVNHVLKSIYILPKINKRLKI